MREIGQATDTNPSSRGGLLPLHSGDNGVDVGEGGEATGATLAAFPPPIFAGTASVSVLNISPPPLDRDHRAGLYIGIFRSG
jgi:hypothetical protein